MHSLFLWWHLEITGGSAVWGSPFEIIFILLNKTWFSWLPTRSGLELPAICSPYYVVWVSLDTLWATRWLIVHWYYARCMRLWAIAACSKQDIGNALLLVLLISLESYEIKLWCSLTTWTLNSIVGMILPQGSKLLCSQERWVIFSVVTLESYPFRVEERDRYSRYVKLLSEVGYGLAFSIVHRAANSELIRACTALILDLKFSDRGSKRRGYVS